MYNMYYNCLQKFYGPRVELCYTDTDSYILYLQTDDMFKDFAKNPGFFDMSQYDPEHPQFGQFANDTNKKKLGYFKDEFQNTIITHVACPRPKMYGLRALKISRGEDGSYLTEEDGSWKMEVVECKKAKGITKAAVKTQIPLDDFMRVMETSIQTFAKMKGIRSSRHLLFTEEVVKRALNGLDTKRYAVDACKTLAFGHCDIEN